MRFQEHMNQAIIVVVAFKNSFCSCFWWTSYGRELNLAPTVASQPAVGLSLSFIISIVFMTLGWGLFVGLAAVKVVAESGSHALESLFNQ